MEIESQSFRERHSRFTRSPQFEANLRFEKRQLGPICTVAAKIKSRL